VLGIWVCAPALKLHDWNGGAIVPRSQGAHDRRLPEQVYAFTVRSIWSALSAEREAAFPPTLKDQIFRRWRLSGLMGPLPDRLEDVLPRCEAWLQGLGVTRVLTPFERDQGLPDALAANIADLVALQTLEDRDTSKEHNLRDVIVWLGKALGVEPFPGRPYKG
jgi:hypothetical protein